MMIRRALKEDIPTILDLLLQVNLVHHEGRPDIFNVGTKYTKEQLEELIKEDLNPIFVAEEDGQVLGYAFCQTQQHIGDNILTDIKSLYIDDLCVDEKARGKHLGTKLLDYVKSFAKENGYYNVTLNVWACNESAMKFYEKSGFECLKLGMEMKM
ncbi:MAG: GNAT family N-acetyltransferase [Lachnospira sp.]|nr:GNAT family N-acetyltransferase [Lachnospira sp.]